MDALTDAEDVLVACGRMLRAAGYSFVTVTPASHARVLAHRSGESGSTLREVFGWNMPFRRERLSPELFEPLLAAGWLSEEGDLWRSRIRYSTVGDLLLVHSGFPTESASSVFLGPDTYRFCRLLARAVSPGATVVDVGCGTGAGGLAVSRQFRKVILSDLNPLALRLARVNALLAGADNVEVVLSDILEGIAPAFDCVISNPPYLVDPGRRAYRHGGDHRGIELAVRIVEQSLRSLPAGGSLILYSGTPVVAGDDLLLGALRSRLDDGCSDWSYSELDPDVFGEELEQETYRDVDRIALVALVAHSR